MSKIVKHQKDARDAILRGVDFLTDVVALTEGPRGRNIILGQRALGQTPKCSRDGVTVCNYTDPEDPTEQLACDLLREASQKTDNMVGDGTTATIVLAAAMIHAGFDAIANSANPMAMERGIHAAADAVIEQLRKMSTSVEGDKIFQVATVSAHGDTTIGRLVADAVEKAGRDGVVTAEPSTTSDTYVDTVAGIELNKSNLLHGAFITHPETVSAQWNDCRILLWEGVIGSARSLVPVLSQVKELVDQKKVTPLLLIAGGYEAEALAVIINARIQIALPIVAVRMDAYGQRRKDLMGDIAALIGGPAFTEDMGKKIENVTLQELGMARKVITNMKKTQIIEGKGNQVELKGRIDAIRGELEVAAGPEKTYLRNRLAALLGGITIVKVGGVTVTEMEEKRDRVIDAMSAAKAAVESGIVAGGGTALLQARPVINFLKLSSEETVGARVVHSACGAIIKQIADNAGLSGALTLDQSMATPNLGFNAVTGQFEDLVETGIIDPTSVVCEALKNAAAVACSILTMGATIAERLTETKNA